MAEGGSGGGREVVPGGGRESARVGNFADPGQSLPALRAGSLGEGMAEEAGTRRDDHRAICRRRRAGVRETRRRRTVSEAVAGTAAEIRAETTRGEDAPDRVRALCHGTTGEAGRREAGNL